MIAGASTACQWHLVPPLAIQPIDTIPGRGAAAVTCDEGGGLEAGGLLIHSTEGPGLIPVSRHAFRVKRGYAPS